MAYLYIVYVRVGVVETPVRLFAAVRISSNVRNSSSVRILCVFLALVYNVFSAFRMNFSIYVFLPDIIYSILISLF